MQHTLIAVFDQQADAQAARDALLGAGFSSATLRQGEPGSAAGASAGKGAGGHGLGAGIRHFFGELFGTGAEHHAERYSEAVLRGQHVLSLVVDGESEVERAAAIVERHGPIDIDEAAGSRLLAGAAAARKATRKDAGAVRQQAGAASLQGAASQGGSAQGGSAQGASQAGTAQGSQQRGPGQVVGTAAATPSADVVGGSAAASAPAAVEPVGWRGRVRIFRQLMASDDGELVALRAEQLSIGALPPEAASDPEQAFRQHYDSALGDGERSYDDYLPAYRYGADAAGSGKFGSQWHEAEPALRKEWESHNPESKWEHFKAAVRHGWEKIRR